MPIASSTKAGCLLILLLGVSNLLAMEMPLPPGFFCGKFVPTPTLHNKLIASGPNGDVLVAESTTVSLKSASTDSIIAKISSPHQDEPVTHIYTIPSTQGKEFLTSSGVGEVKVWSLGASDSNPTMTHKLKLFNGPIRASVYHQTLGVVVSLAEDGTIKVWDHKTGTTKSVIPSEGVNKYLAMDVIKYQNETYLLAGSGTSVKILELSKDFKFREDRKILPPVSGGFDIITTAGENGYFIVGVQMASSYFVYNVGIKGDNPLDTKQLSGGEHIYGIKYIPSAKSLGVTSKKGKGTKSKDTVRIYRMEEKKGDVSIYQQATFTDFKDLSGNGIVAGQIAVSESASKLFMLVSNGLKEYKITEDAVMASSTGECYYPCPFGSNPVGNTCEKCHASCLTCSGPSAKECYFCKPGLFYFNSFCFDLCPKGALAHHENSTCSCNPRYTYNSQGFCERKSLRQNIP
jgi:hypothetical protein